MNTFEIILRCNTCKKEKNEKLFTKNFMICIHCNTNRNIRNKMNLIHKKVNEKTISDEKLIQIDQQLHEIINTF